jgi:hypothetical protein
MAGPPGKADTPRVSGTGRSWKRLRLGKTLGFLRKLQHRGVRLVDRVFTFTAPRTSQRTDRCQRSPGYLTSARGHGFRRIFSMGLPFANSSISLSR